MFNIIKFLFICVIVHASEVTQKELNKNLIQSIKANDLVLTKKLLDQGADINCANRLGDRPITLAIENQNLRLVMELLERGADVNAVDGNNRTPVMRAMECLSLSCQRRPAAGGGVGRRRLRRGGGCHWRCGRP